MMQQQYFLFYPHKKQFRFELTQKVSFCFNCSSAIITDVSGDEISTVKPLKYYIPQETAFPIFVNISDEHKPIHFLNKTSYLKLRKQIVIKMKKFCNQFNLNKKTFFLALDYLDQICSRMSAFDKENLRQISQICIIISCKLQENQSKAIEIKKLSKVVSVNYSEDELYLLSLLNYDLYRFTSYDILMDIINCGFLFNNELFSTRKMESFYKEIENILYLFSESKFYIDMTHKEIAMAIVGLIREKLGLIAFSKDIQIVFMNEYENIHNYLSCLHRIGKCFKFNVDNTSHNTNNNNNHSDSNTDANSDGNSDNTSEKNTNSYNSNNIEKKNVNNSQKKEN